MTSQPISLSQLQGLPAELRLKVYSGMSSPFDIHIGENRGIIMANRLFKSEVEAEWIRNMRKFLQSVMDAWSTKYAAPLRINLPTTILGIKNIKIAIPKSVVRAEIFFRHFPAALLPLLDISSMTITFYEDEVFDEAEHPGIQWQALHHFGGGMIWFISRIRQVLDKRALLRCDDGSEQLRKDTFQVDTLKVEWGELTPMDQGVLRCRLDWGGVLERRQLEEHETNHLLVGATWHKVRGIIWNEDGEIEERSYSRDLANH
jgi:hypothetical protein